MITNSNREGLKKAIESCKKEKAILALSYLNLKEDLDILLMLKKSGVEFICASNENYKTETLDLMILISQNMIQDESIPTA